MSWLKQYSSRKISVQIDGGVTPTIAAQARALGVDILVAGSAIFSTKNYKQAISELRG